MKPQHPKRFKGPALPGRRPFVLSLASAIAGAWSGAPAWAQALAEPAGGASAARLPLAPPPVAPVRPVTEHFFGTAVTDNYRYFENIRDPEVAAWMKAQADFARRQLDELPERANLRSRLAALDASAGERATRVQRAGNGALFYLHQGPQDNQYRLVVRAPGASGHRVLMDPQQLQAATGQPHAINFFRPSPSGRAVAYAVSAAGSEAATLHVIDVASGRPLCPPLERADEGVPQWVNDGEFLVKRLHPPGPGRTAEDKDRDSLLERVRLARPGQPASAARVSELPLRRWPGLGLSREMEGIVRPADGGRLALLLLGDGVRNEMAFHVGPWAALGRPNARWQPVVGFEDGVVGFALHGATLYGISHRGAPRHQVLAWNLRRPADPPRVVMPASDRVVLALHAARDALYISTRDGNSQSLWRVAHTSGAQPQAVELPVRGQIYLDAGYGQNSHAAEQDGLVIGLQSWTRAPQYHLVAPGGRVLPLNLPPLGPDDAPPDIVATEVLVPSHDGARVPLSILHRRGLKLDGRNPVWLTAYASYGMTIEPSHTPARMAWLERGGVLAFANPRGSGVFGQAWYEAGKQATKPNTWKDVIACAEYLVREGWTAPRHLGLSGRSAGGLLVGRVLVERPDLFGAVVPQVGVQDALRMEFTPNGPSNIPEFGSVRTEPGFRALLAMSPYANVKDGTRFPPVLLTHGVNDPRVEVWQSMKFAARLQAASSSTQPVWLSLRYDSGHGMGDTRSQRLDDNADLYAFLWHFLGRG